MKRALTLVLSVFTVGLLASPVFADSISLGNGDPFTLIFDENGNGSYSDNGGPFVNDPGVVIADPGNGGNPGLAYALPELVGCCGYAAIADESGTSISDELGFQFINGTYYMFFYSQVGGGTLADRGIPSPNALVFATESGDNFSFACQTGNNCYQGTSIDGTAVPEPFSLSLLATGVAGLAINRRRRLRR